MTPVTQRPGRLLPAVTLAVCAPALAAGHLVASGRLPGLLALGAALAVALLVAVVVAAAVARPPVVATVGAALLTGHGTLTLLGADGLGASGSAQGCLPAVGRGAELGLRLAIGRADPTCVTDGSLTAGSTGTAAPVLLAVGLVLAHALVATGAGVLATALTAVTAVRAAGRLAAAGLVRVATALLRGLAATRSVPTPVCGMHRVQPAGAVRLAFRDLRPQPPARRGPPAGTFA